MTSSRLGAAAAVCVAVAACAGYWWLAIPRHDICAMVLPAPAGCAAAGRLPAASLWTAVVVILGAVTVAGAFGRRRLLVTGLAGLVVAAPYGYFSVLY